MMTALNYIIEANLALVVLLAFYYLCLRRETWFSFMRMYLLTSIAASLLFPLIPVTGGNGASPLSIDQVIPSYWLPEVVVGVQTETDESVLSFWTLVSILYAIGVAISFAIVFYELIALFRLVRRSTTYALGNLRIAESSENASHFSFFNYIFIGNAHGLSHEEKEQIICHERVHAAQWHSFDILLVNLLKILFWFNPIVNLYKKTFIQLHEFEADARAVENSDVNKYCNLLARVALQSAGFTLANHFNNSLTVKRIEMMRTIKRRIQQWKLVAVVTVLPLVFVFIACQDQIEHDLTEITRNSSHALMVPVKIQERYDFLKKANPERNYALLELNETASQKLDALKDKYGLPGTVEVFSVDGETVSPAIVAKSGGTFVFEQKQERKSKDRRNFAIIEFDDRASRIADAAQQEDKVYTVVERQPEFVGGYDAMMEFIKGSLRYPEEARKEGIEGTVYAQFIVEKDGSISEVKIIRGISAACDNEVKRLVEQFPNWVPAQQNGETVRVRFVLPVKFSLGKETSSK